MKGSLPQIDQKNISNHSHFLKTNISTKFKPTIHSLHKYFNHSFSNKKQKNKQYLQSQLLVKEGNQRKWLRKRRKKEGLIFELSQIKEVKKYFVALDKDSSGSIGIQQLGNPFISLGLVNSIKQIEKLVETVDDNKNGQIEFRQFLNIIKNARLQKGQNKMFSFFKNMLKNKGGFIRKNVSFDQIIRTKRRQDFLQYMKTKNHDRRKEIMNVMLACRSLQDFNRVDRVIKTECCV